MTPSGKTDAAGRGRKGRRPPPPPPPRPIDYGLDTPHLAYGFGWGGMAALTIAVVLIEGLVGPLSSGRALAAALFAIGIACVTIALGMAASSRWGKVAMRDRLLDALALHGDEQALDVGCGRGLMLIGAATRLTANGRAVGIDRWTGRDGRAASRAATMENARRAGVAERVTVHEADPRALPFADGHFDLVLSSLAIHHLPTVADRAAALGEVLRVTRPGGRIVIVDTSGTARYARELGARGASSVLRSGPRFWIFPPVRLILARR